MSRVRDFSKINMSQPKKRFTANEIEAFDRHGWHCHYCRSPGPLTADHLIPRAHGGGDNWENLIPACRTCNSSRGVKPYDEFLDIIAADLAAYHMFVECRDFI